MANSLPRRRRLDRRLRGTRCTARHKAYPYARFGRSPTATFWGTAVGYLLAQVWFFALGILFLLSIGSGDVIAALLAVPVGLLAMAVLVVDETDEVFANLYSAGVSLKNAAPGLPGRSTRRFGRPA